MMRIAHFHSSFHRIRCQLATNIFNQMSMETRQILETLCQLGGYG